MRNKLILYNSDYFYFDLFLTCTVKNKDMLHKIGAGKNIPIFFHVIATAEFVSGPAARMHF